MTDYTEAQMRSFVPTQSPNSCRYVKRSPAIDYSNDAGAPKLGEERIWTWDPSRPDILTESYSGTNFPNAAFPTVIQNTTSHSGKSVTLTKTTGPYPGDITWYSPNGNDGSKLDVSTDGVWLEGCLNYHKGYYFYRTLLRGLANAYDGSAAKEPYAERVLVLLELAAGYHEDSFVLRYHNSDLVVTPTECEQDPWRNQPWYNCRLWSTYNGFAHELDWSVYALDAIKKVRESPSAAALAAARGYDVAQRCFDGILGVEADYVKKPRIADYIKGNLLGWISPLVSIAIDAQRAADVDYLISYLTAGVANIGRDGVYLESYTYAQHAMAGFSEGALHVERYFAAHPPESGAASSATSYQDLLQLVRLFDWGHTGLLQIQMPLWPRGQWPANGDNTREGFVVDREAGTFRAYKDPTGGAGSSSSSSSSSSDGYKWLEANRTDHSWLLPAYGAIALRSDGKSDTASQTNIELFQNGNYGHCSMQANSIQLSAFGVSLIDGKRYERTRQRFLHGHTTAWSTVVINQRPQTRFASNVPLDATTSAYMAGGAQVRVFEDGRADKRDRGAAGSIGISVAETDGFRSYFPVASRYSRLMAHHDRDPEHPYVLDIFRVQGGWHHEYTLHGSTQMNMDAELLGTHDVGPMAQLAGDHPLLPQGMAWSEPPQSFGFPASDLRWYGAYRYASRYEDKLPHGGNWTASLHGRCDGREIPACDPTKPGPPSLRVWHPAAVDAAGNPAAPQQQHGVDVEEELVFAQDPHNYRLGTPDVNSLPIPDERFPAD
eukprot:g4271.t1